MQCLHVSGKIFLSSRFIVAMLAMVFIHAVPSGSGVWKDLPSELRHSWNVCKGI